MSITGKYHLSLPLPGRNRDAALELTEANGVISGTFTNPYKPEEKLPIYDGAISDKGFSFKSMVGRVEYTFSGLEKEKGLELCLTTKETIVLDPGKRILGVSGEIAGEYLVGVYSPGGVKENHIVIHNNGGLLSGEMFGLVTQQSLDQMAEMMGKMPPPGPGGPPAGMPGPMEKPKLGDKSDLNVFSSGAVTGDGFYLETVTAQGSLFRFEGKVSGDDIFLTMHVTDQTDGLSAAK